MDRHQDETDIVESEHEELLLKEARRVRNLARTYRKGGTDIIVSNQELRKIMLENIKREQRSVWPFGLLDKESVDVIIVFTCIFAQCYYLCSCITQEFENQLKRRRKAIDIYTACKDHLSARANYIWEAAKRSEHIGKPVRIPEWTEEGWAEIYESDWSKMGSGASSESLNSQSGSVEELNGAEYSYSLIDLRSYHASTIGLAIIFFLIITGGLWCAWKRHRRLYQEVSLHRARAGILPLSQTPTQRILNDIREINRMGVDFGQKGSESSTNFIGPSTVLQVAEEVRRQTAEELRLKEDEARIKNIREKY